MVITNVVSSIRTVHLRSCGGSAHGTDRFGNAMEMKAMTFLLSLCGSLSATALAQTACPQGVTPGSSQCLPTVLGAAQASSPPHPRWKTTWGAIAMSSETGEVGTSVGRFSKREARREAMDKCERLGGTQCQLAIAYENQCAVVAWASEAGTPTGGAALVQGAATIAEATKLAIPACSK